MTIDTEALIKHIRSICDDTTHTKEESRDAYAEIEEAAATSRAALDEEIAREGEDECEQED